MDGRERSLIEKLETEKILSDTEYTELIDGRDAEASDLLAKKADKTMEQCIQDFYRYNKDFTPEHEKYIRENWDQIK